MAHHDAGPSGPDLQQGIDASGIHEGTPLLGHAQGESVVLTRCDGRLYALGATCTHYGGPLAEGAVVDGTIRCPWHHAAFDLATGRAVRGPALSALPCYQVVERDGRAFVMGRVEPERAAPRGPAGRDAPESVVVLGGGAAGMAAVIRLREEGYDRTITIVSDEHSTPVDRPNLSKDYLAGTAQEDWLPLRPDSWYAENGITLLRGRTAAALDPRARSVQLDDGSSITYGALLLATGAEPIRLPLGEESRVLYLRTLQDCHAIIRAASGARTAVVLGASFIGLEVAASLRTRGLDVTVVAPESQPLERVLGAALGAAVRDIHESRGIAFRLGRTARAADARGVMLDDGTRVDGDFVVAGVGVRPRIGLAEQAGLTIDRGVVVDAFLQTGAPDVFAAGDVAKWPDPHSGRPIRVEHWVLAQRHGATAALNMLGAAQTFDGVPFFWSAHYENTISYVGHAEQPDRVEVDGDPRQGDCEVRYIEKGRVAAVATMGRDRASLAAEAAMEHALRSTPAASVA